MSSLARYRTAGKRRPSRRVDQQQLPGLSEPPAGLGSAIRQLAQKRNLYLMEVAKRAGTSPSGMTRILDAVDAGHVTLSTLMRIAAVLDARLEVRLVELRHKATAKPPRPARRPRPRARVRKLRGT